MAISFRRITSSQAFIPEIDGLRFLAIASVVAYHLTEFLTTKVNPTSPSLVDFSFLHRCLNQGNLGVPLFFVISGFVLGLPFAKHFLGGEKRLSLKAYYLRRLTRLEPPYILVLTALFLGSTLVAKTVPWESGLLSYLASLIYSHGFFYPGEFSPILGVAWSLEVEVQFYVLAPALAYVFALSSPRLRRGLMAGLALGFAAWNQFSIFEFRSLLNYAHFFLAGWLLADLRISQTKPLPKTMVDGLIGLFFLGAMALCNEHNSQIKAWDFLLEAGQCLSMFAFCYYVIFQGIFRWLSLPFFTGIGGMCYSIYLLHYPLISLFGNALVKHSFSEHGWISISLCAATLVAILLAISAVFFLLIERPCMDRNWIRKISGC